MDPPDKTGAWHDYNPGDKTYPAKAILFSGGLFVVTADVETDDVSNVTVKIHEHRVGWVFENGDWQKKLDIGVDVPEDTVGVFAQEGQVGTGTIVEIKSPPNKKCKYRVVVVDAPCVWVQVGGRDKVDTGLPATMKMGVTQTVTIGEKGGKSYGITQKFSYGVGQNGAMLPFKFTPGTSTADN